MVVGFTKQLMVLEPDATQVEIAEDDRTKWRLSSETWS